MNGLGLLLAIGLALIHTFAAKLNISKIIPEHRWLSFAGGVSISYVFLEIFPELSHAQKEIEHSASPFVAYLENHVYILALSGLLVFYGLDIWAFSSRKGNQATHKNDRASPIVFGIRVMAFAVLNAIFGYLLLELSDHTLLQSILFFVAAALHFFIIDYNLREHHEHAYDQYGRWFLTAAIIGGPIIGQAIHLDKAALSTVWAFLAGSIILNILKRELPDENQSCFWSFVGGSTLYAVLLLWK